MERHDDRVNASFGIAGGFFAGFLNLLNATPGGYDRMGRIIGYTLALFLSIVCIGGALYGIAAGITKGASYLVTGKSSWSVNENLQGIAQWREEAKQRAERNAMYRKVAEEQLALLKVRLADKTGPSALAKIKGFWTGSLNPALPDPHFGVRIDKDLIIRENRTGLPFMSKPTFSLENGLVRVVSFPYTHGKTVAEHIINDGKTYPITGTGDVLYKVSDDGQRLWVSGTNQQPHQWREWHRVSEAEYYKRYPKKTEKEIEDMYAVANAKIQAAMNNKK